LHDVFYTILQGTLHYEKKNLDFMEKTLHVWQIWQTISKKKLSNNA